jgi:hypothetical protein
MILLLSDSLSRALLALVTLLAALWLAFFGVRSGIAGLVSEGDSSQPLELAARLESGNPEYWYRLAHYQQFNLEQPDIVASVASYHRAVALDPGYTDAWLDLGTAYELDGNTAAARDAFEHAKKAYPASGEVAWRYGNFLLRQGQLPEAFAELKVTLESDPRRAGAVFSRVYRADPDIDAIVNNLLPAVPAAYLNAIGEAVDSRQLAVAQTMWMKLMSMKPTLQLGEFNKLVSALLANGDYDAALRIWEQGTSTMNLPPLIQPQGSVIWDPSFESGITNESFAWSFKPLLEGVHTQLDTSEKLSGKRSLRVTFDGMHNPELEIACATGVVNPGTKYLFSGWIKTRELTGDEGVRFHLRPLGNIPIPVEVTKEIHGTMPWTLLDEQWAAGPGVHRIEVCISREPSTNADIHIAGDVWVDDVTLVPQAPEPRAPERRKP